MFLFLLIVIIGGSYLYYRYYIITDKKRFFGSPLFIAVSGSLGILLFSVLFVNTIAPETRPKNDLSPSFNFLSVEESDTRDESLLAKEPGFHFNLIKKISNQDRYANHLSALEQKYQAFTRATDPHATSLGNFCLGVICMERGEDEKAREYLNAVADDNLPYLHFCRGAMLTKDNNTVEAELEYTLELEHESGNRKPSFLALLQIYSDEQNFDKLHELLKYEEADGLFPDNLARTTLLHAGNFLHYHLWLVKMLVRRTHAIGFIAALLIGIMWLVYLFRLDIFKPEKVISLVALFVGGMLSVPLVFLFSDVAGLFTSWSLNDAFFNDLMYSIFMIGVPEEFAKALPLFLLVALRRYLHEPIDYIIYGCASALGFAFIENLLYFQDIGGGIIHGRAYMSVIGHMTDTSLVAYGFVIARYQLKDNRALRYVLPLSFFSACAIHGIYDFLLFQEMIFLFFMFFVLVVQVWLIMVNNCMNNSSHFNYKLAPRAERSRIFITLALTSIFALEYITVSFKFGADQGNSELLYNTTFAGSLIIFFSSNLGSFDLIKGYWRNVRMNHIEKRGYGSRQRIHPFISWYFVNSSQAHNYVGQQITVSNDPYNKNLADILHRPVDGRIIDRITLYDVDQPDPHWFLVRLTETLPITEANAEYVLVKLRYTEDSLLYEDEVEVHFRAVSDVNTLRGPKPDKQSFPFYGWAYISMRKERTPVAMRELKEA